MLVLASTAARPEAVELELLLAVDASTSVDFREFNLQMAGYAAAFRDPEFAAAVEALAGGGVAVCLLLWAGSGQSTVAIDWSILRDGAAAAAFADTVDRMPRRIRGGSTAIGDAVAHAVALLRDNAIAGHRRVIDLSGDGRANDGAGVAEARQSAARLGITINALAIRNEEPDLARYYARALVTGPAAFVETVEGYEGFAAAVRRKLIREVRGGLVARAPPPRAGAAASAGVR